MVATFIWIGFILAISFMEAWLKFRAPGITIPLGLGIGRLVFSALNKVEWVMAVLVFANIFLSQNPIFTLLNLLFFIVILLLLIQTFYLLPALDIRAEMHIQGQIPPPSNLHFYYIGFECIKVICLLLFGTGLLKNTTIP